MKGDTMIAREIKVVDTKGRVQIPKNVLAQSNIKVGDQIIFDITKTGSIVLRKAVHRVTREYDDENGIRNIEIGVVEDGK